MSLILLYGERFSGQRELAPYVAADLGYHLVTPDAVIERAAAWGASQTEILRILAEVPRPLDRFLRRTDTQWRLLRAALAEELRDGNAVCYGELADLLLAEELPALRVQVLASAATRVDTVGWLLKCPRPDAAAFLKSADRARQKWLRLLLGRAYDKSAPDLVVNLDRIDPQEACVAVTTLVRMGSSKAVRSIDNLLLENFIVASRVSAALATDPATGHLDVRINSDRGRVSIRGRFPEPQDFVEVQRVAGAVPGVSRIVLNGEEARRLEAREIARDHRPISRQRLRPALLATGLGMAAILFLSILVARMGSFLTGSEVIQGVVTDNRCGARHPGTESAQCVIACVKQGARYMLDDGKGLYELSNQRDAGRFAARKVKVRGFLEKGSHYLRVQSMELLSSPKASWLKSDSGDLNSPSFVLPPPRA